MRLGVDWTAVAAIAASIYTLAFIISIVVLVCQLTDQLSKPRRGQRRGVLPAFYEAEISVLVTLRGFFGTPTLLLDSPCTENLTRRPALTIQ